MANLNLIVLYVEDPAASAAFYEKLLGAAPAVMSPNFYAFPMAGNGTLGLWRKSHVKPEPTGSGAANEIGIMLPGADAIAACHERWSAAGVDFEQDLATLDFGPTFVARDPDGHRIRVCLLDN
ncbi:VOC family protein [Mesorhizobium sp. BR1-1-16]|uniref:VOC family protein n=1 Tax=Mesorhizobium sp. BR1-1-16 TaxID=2876653 RepID=UPI001CCAB646|nr:VOC family protein [Mesorhizobium sp. BR1-1-16]MBZ9935875.1 VOC family protein [Mesorhizobium sp. BR1-1-16]